MVVRRLVMAVAILVVVSACTPGASETATTSSTTVTAASSSSSTTTAAEPPSTTTTIDATVATVDEALGMLVDSPELAVAPGLLDGVDLDAGLPDGAVVTPVDGMVVVSGDTAEVLVDVVLPDGRSDQFVVVLVNDGVRWLVVYTVLVS
jgi:hypothetical protein